MELMNAQIVMLNTLIYVDEDNTLGYFEDRKSVSDVIKDIERDLDAGKEVKGGSMTNAEWRALVDNIKADGELMEYTVTNYRSGNSSALYTKADGAQELIADNGMRAACFVRGEGEEQDVQVVFRGTNGDIEWQDNAMASYTSDSGQQKLAALYIENLPEEYGNSLTVSGHSKGGNKAQYATIATDRVACCISIDGQGFSPEFIEKYGAAISEKSERITSISAEKDIVNRLLHNIAGTNIYIETEQQDAYWLYHKPNLLLDGSGALNPTSEEQSSLSRLVGGYSIYISSLDKLERAVMSAGVASYMKEKKTPEDISQIIIAGLDALSHIDDFTVNGTAAEIRKKIIATLLHMYTPSDTRIPGSAGPHHGDHNYWKSRLQNYKTCEATALTPPYRDPLVLDLDKDGGISPSRRAYFDYDGDGVRELGSWFSSHDGLLAIDKNKDGAINDGSELFGDAFVKENGAKAANGMDALRDIDGNGDGAVDAQDEKFADLRIWKDTNGDGVSQAEEIHTLEELGVVSLGTSSETVNQTDAFGNTQINAGTFTFSDGTEGAMGDWSLQTNHMATKYDYQLSEEQKAA